MDDEEWHILVKWVEAEKDNELHHFMLVCELMVFLHTERHMDGDMDALMSPMHTIPTLHLHEC